MGAGLIGPAYKLMFRLPNEFPTDLPNPRVVGIRDVSEASAADVAARIEELRVVEYVEEFRTKLQKSSFRYRDSLRYSQISVVDAWTMEESAISRPETPAIITKQYAGVPLPIRVYQIAGSCGKCALIKIRVRARGTTRVPDVNRSHDVRHIGGRAADQRGISYAQGLRVSRVRVYLRTQPRRI